MRCLIVLAALLIPFGAQAIDYQHSTSADIVNFAWSVDGDDLHIKLSAKTTGWVGIGFNPTESMKDATFFVARARGDQVRVSTHIGTSSFAHSEADDAAEATAVSGKEAAGVTEAAFTVPLVLKNPKYKPIEVDKEITVLLAYATQDGTKAQHRYHAELLVNLRAGTAKIVKEGS